MKRFIIAIIAISSYLSSYAQMDTEFWFAAPFFNCPHGETSPYKLVVFSFDQAATVTISMPANPSFTPITKNIPANGYTSIVLANNKQDGDNKITSPYNSISQRGLLIQSTSKVECYYQVDGDNSEAYTLKGKNALGRDFLIIGQKSYSNGTSGSTAGSRCSVHIVATEDHTEVQINPSAAILLSNGNSSSAPITIMLNKGETYAIASYNVQATMNLIGTTITSSKPIAVTINDDSVMLNSNADCIGEQILPTDFAGTKFIVVSGGNRYDACIIFALQNNTQITTSQGGIYNINRGSYQTISMNGVNAMSIQTSQPVMVFQILSTVSGSGEMGGSIVPHVECTGSSIAGYKSYSSSYNLYINLITKKSNISHFAINGVGLSASSFLPVDVSDEYYYARVQKQASSTPYVVTCSSGLFQMGVTEGNSYTSSTYGFFSDYAEQVPILVDVNSMPVDSVYYTNRTESLSLFAHPESGFDLSNIEWTLPDGSKRYGSTLNLGAFKNNLLGEYSVTGTTTQCGVIDHPFVIKLNTVEADEYASFCEGNSFTWSNHFLPDGVTPMTFSAEGTYRDTITSASGSDSICILHLTSMPLPEMTIRPDTTIMPGESVFLWAKGVDYCRWTPENTLTKTDELKIYARPTATTTYIATGYSILSSSQNVVYNGGFEDGNTGFNSNLNYITPYTITGGCGDYTITDNVKGFWMRYSHSSTAYSGTNMMIIDGGTSPNSIIWQQNVQVEPHTYYAFSAQVMSCLTSNSYGQYALLQFSVNGTQLGPIFHSPSKLYNWTQYYQIWYSGDNTTATLTILNQNNSGNGNDFALDEIRFDALDYSCEAVRQVTINVKGQDTDSTEIADICAGDTYTWHGRQFNTTTTITETIPNSAGGDSVCTLLLTVLEPSDSTEIATICAGKTYTWHGQTFRSSVTKTETLTNAVGCDSVCTLQLTVLPPITTDISASITEGASFTWNGQTYKVAGDYPSSFTTDEGCDSVVTLHLTVNPLTYEILTHTQCADDPYVEFEVVATDALFHHLQFAFAPNALNQHFRDTIVDFSNSFIQIPNSARAGIYDVAISTLLDNQVLDTRSYQFTLLYPSSVLDQHWDDFIGVLTHDYNGGYDFSGFQWYKDGTPIPGENHSYLYQPLEMGASYSAMLEEKDGTKLMTCEITAIPQTEIALYPTLLQPHQLVRLHSSDEVMIQLYNNLGTLVSSHIFSSGDYQFAAPSERGVYIVKLQQTSTNGKSATKKLLVR